MARTWISIRVDLVGGGGQYLNAPSARTGLATHRYARHDSLED